MTDSSLIAGIAKTAISRMAANSRSRKLADDPVEWVRHYLGFNPWSKQRDILYSVRDNRATAVAAGHGIGKTLVAAAAAMWWVHTHPPDKTFIASTAPTVDQVALLWDNIRNFHSLMKARFDSGLIDVPPVGYITGDNKWKLPNGSLIGQGRKPSSETLGHAFQGRHADYLLAIGDEAVGIPEELLNALGVIATGKYNRQLIQANPTDPTCAMAKIWSTENPNWVRMHISVMDSPLITQEEGFDIAEAPGLSGWEFVEQARADYGGEDDPRYIARVLGQWAFDKGNNVFTEEDIARGMDTVVLPFTNMAGEFGCDIARMGTDWSFVYRMERGEVWVTDEDTGEPLEPTGREGYRLRRVEGWSKAPLVGDDPENLSSTVRIHDLAMAEGVSVVKVDASGIGSAVVDGLAMKDGRYVVVEVFAGAPPTDKRAYINARAEQIFRFKKLLASRELDIDPEDEKLLDEIRGVGFEYADNGALKIESKDVIRKRGGKSPDRFDAAWMSLMDVSELVSGPLAGLHRGDKVFVDPFKMLQLEIDGAGMPG